MKESSLDSPVSFKNILLFTLPSICGMLFLSFYTTVDAIFVARLVSDQALAAINLAFPVLSIILAIGLMLASGANAKIAYHLGEGKSELAGKKLATTYALGLLTSTLIIAATIPIAEPILRLIGTSDELMPYALPYLRAMILFSPAMIFQIFTQFFLVTDGYAKRGLILSLICGFTNIILDYLILSHTDIGITGAAIATGTGYSIYGLYGLYHFAIKRRGALKFFKPVYDLKFIREAVLNGSSEMVNNLSIAWTTFLYNKTMLSMVGTEGVVAITIILYLQFMQISLYLGYAQGVSPIASYKYGGGKFDEIGRVIKISLYIMVASSLLVIAFSAIFSDRIINIFIDTDVGAFSIAREGFLLNLASYIFMGVNIFITALFTSLGKGKASALIAFIRTFLFISVALILLPKLLGIRGVWLAAPLAEGLTTLFILWLWKRVSTHL